MSARRLASRPVSPRPGARAAWAAGQALGRGAACLLLLAGLCVLPGPARGEGPAAVPWADEVGELLRGVQEVAAPGVPGSLAVWGEQAFPVVLGREGERQQAPVVAAARLGKGRIVALGHTGYGSRESCAAGDTQRLLENAIRWAAGGKERPAALAVVEGSLEGTRWGEPRLLRGRWRDTLAGVDVLVALGSALDATQAGLVETFLRGGGGLLVAQTGWGWQQVNEQPDLRLNAWNRLLLDAGLGFGAATLERTGKVGFRAGEVPGPEFHAARALRLLADGPARRERGAEGLLPQAAATLLAALDLQPAGRTGLRGELARLRAREGAGAVPTPRAPLEASQALERLLLALDLREGEALPTAQVRAHPAAEAFPGAVPASAKAVTRVRTLDLATPGWHSTGVYARPGVPVSCRVSPRLGHAETPALRLQVGCHSDTLWHLDAWPRVPALLRSVPLEGDGAVLASPFGGLVYVVVDRPSQGSLQVTVEGGVPAPFFESGRTAPEAWALAREAPAPWGELASGKLVLSVPSEVLRTLDDPQALLDLWDRILDGCADLAGRPRARERAERIVADVAISAGYMHSGYPIMTHLDAAPRMVDARLLATQGDWGLFHELGHNHQSEDWTFEGTVEVTVNLFTLYVREEVLGLVGTAGHEAFRTRGERTRKHFEGGLRFEAWKQDPFLALEMYVQLREAFGWQPFREVFRAYRDLPAKERPLSEDDKRDQWLQRMSRQVGRNLGPFFNAWGVPTREKARAALAELPAWMPEGFPPR